MKIQIEEKDDSISYEIIHQVLEKAHQKHKENGFVLKTSKLSGEELKKRIGENGKCFVALHDGKVVGTLSVRLVKRNTWYAKGIIPDYILAGILPEYQGKHINTMLSNKAFDYSKNNGFDRIELDTAEKNKQAIKVYQHLGFRLVDFKAFSGADHYSVVMIKNFYKFPYSKVYYSLRFLIKKYYIKLRYKIGGKKRFRI